MNRVGVNHVFEAGHRLPHLGGGKHANLHGHSWHVELVFASDQPVGPGGVLAELGYLKSGIRGWIGTYLDHGLMLGVGDTLLPALRGAGKVYRFGVNPAREADFTDAESLAAGLLWPTVENVATLLSRVGDQVAGAVSAHLFLQSVRVAETGANFAQWVRPAPPSGSAVFREAGQPIAAPTTTTGPGMGVVTFASGHVPVSTIGTIGDGRVSHWPGE